MQGQSQQQQGSKQQDLKKSLLSRMILTIILILLFCLPPLTFYWLSWINSGLLAILLSMIAIAVTLLAPSFDHIVERFEYILYQFRHRHDKKDFLISYTYTRSGHRWALWIERELIKAGYEDNIILRDWYGNKKEPGNDFRRAMQDASRDAKYIISLVSPEYINPIYLNKKWYHDFKRRNRSGGKGILVRIDNFELDEALASIPKIDFIGVNESVAIVRLLSKLPSKFHRSNTKQVKDASSANEEPRFPGNFPRRWNIPRLNECFTGRSKILEDLHTTSQNSKTKALLMPQALTGLRGIGTTEIAKEYAHRYRNEYTCGLWIHMPPHKKHEEDLREIGRQLELPQQNENIPELRKAIVNWLDDPNNYDWLLILDQCSDPTQVRDFIPQKGKGYILLTTHVNSMENIAHKVPVGKMEEDEGALLLLRRAGYIRSDEPLEKASRLDRNVARSISEATGGLPRALDLAGKLISRGITLLEFFAFYKLQRRDVIEKFKELVKGEDEAVAFTWYVAFEKIKNTHPVAAELLQFCVFLCPDAIPIEIIKNAPILSPTLKAITSNDLELLNTVMELGKYSLMDRDRDTGTLSMYRLVQDVLKDEMDTSTRNSLAEQVVQAVNQVFPSIEHANWQDGQKYISHAQACLNSKDLDIKSKDAVQLLSKSGSYLRELGSYTEAERLLILARKHAYEVFGTDHPATATVLNNLARLYSAQGRYSDAEPLYIEALGICRQSYKSSHLDIATNLNDLAELRRNLGRYAEAEIDFKEAQNIRENLRGSEHLEVATVLNNLGNLYKDWSNLDKAKEFYEKALDIREKTLSSKHPDVAMSKNNIAEIHRLKKEYSQAEQLYKDALDICRDTLGLDHLDTIQVRTNLGTLCRDKGTYADAAWYYKDTLEASKRILGLNHPQIATRLNNLAKLYVAQSEDARIKRDDAEAELYIVKAEQHYKKAKAICELRLGLDHPFLAEILRNYAALKHAKHVEREDSEAEQYYERALKIYEDKLGPENPQVAATLLDYADLLYDQNKPAATQQYRKSWEVYKKILSPQYPQAIKALRGYADFLYNQKTQSTYQELMRCYEEAVEIYKRKLGKKHLWVADVLWNYAYFLNNMREATKAAQLEEEAKKIRDENNKQK